MFSELIAIIYSIIVSQEENDWVLLDRMNNDVTEGLDANVQPITEFLSALTTISCI